MTIASAIFLLFLIMDPFANVPIFLGLLKNLPAPRRRAIIIRELLIALLILLIFMFSGKYILQLLQISESSLGVAGGVVLFLISLKMIFSGSEDIFANTPEGEPLVVPLAVPLIAGPSAIAAVILIMANDPNRWMDWSIALLVAWSLVGIILIFSEKFSQHISHKAFAAIERLMGILLTIIAVDMILDGIKKAFGL
ncbi:MULTISPECIES: MarC family protein [Candidatus Thioglobus]|jgi:multiple antibiotic resistance protein|uniref:MarC family protein n=2 Tax=Candidatus Pseudothioglobaceae TaxID=3399801 RepID=UPI0025BE9BF7|nr:MULTISPECIES: MarC family protein [Candidatus Thioglobus]MBT3277741.1 MarC family protein [Candidatus Thioglobus sp.]MBT6752886.1 MarC family protein [Candidatus Thioglobus sp.]WPE17868.1 MarC family protein [Candidatus Thioglobus autotrophicus]